MYSCAPSADTCCSAIEPTWKRLSSPGSFSMNFLYLSADVHPTTRTSPLQEQAHASIMHAAAKFICARQRASAGGGADSANKAPAAPLQPPVKSNSLRPRQSSLPKALYCLLLFQPFWLHHKLRHHSASRSYSCSYHKHTPKLSPC